MIHYIPYITVYVYHYTYIIKICRSPRLDRTRFDVGLGVDFGEEGPQFASGISAAIDMSDRVIKGGIFV